VRWVAKIDEKEIAVTSGGLATFKQAYVSGNLAARMSDLLVFDMYVLDAAFGVSPQEIHATLHNLEAGEPENGVKRATQFRLAPLKGLWHKHYFSAHFLAANILLGLGKDGMKNLAREVFDQSEPLITEKMIREMSHRVANEPIEKRYDEGKLTGEWMIYAKHSDQNYYLALNTHDAGDQFVFDRIFEHCPKNFPALASWIAKKLQ
jgi:hypothetical protein